MGAALASSLSPIRETGLNTVKVSGNEYNKRVDVIVVFLCCVCIYIFIKVICVKYQEDSAGCKTSGFLCVCVCVYPLCFIYLVFTLYQSIVDLQCCVSSKYTAK